jgi:hypothetical protein
MSPSFFGFKLRRSGGLDSKAHKVNVKAKKSGGHWRAVHNSSDIDMHSTVRLAHKPHIEGEVRFVDHYNKRVEFNHKGSPIHVPLDKIRVWVKKK